MSDIDIPTHSEFGQDVIDLFFEDSINIFFYFEDAHHESVYERLLYKLIPDIREFRVICLGGKTKIKAKAKEKNENGSTRIFVVDKDFDDLLGDVIVHPNVYYLHAFSIENYLSQFEAILNLAIELDAKKLNLLNAKQLCSGYRKFENKLKARLEEIAKYFIVARKHRVSVTTTKMAVEDILPEDSVDFVPTAEWIDLYKNKIIQSLNHKNQWLESDESFEIELSNAFAKHPNSSFIEVNNSDHICGKHLIGCIVRYIQNALSVNITEIDSVEMYLRLVNHSNIGNLSFLKEKICADHPELLKS